MEFLDLYLVILWVQNCFGSDPKTTVWCSLLNFTFWKTFGLVQNNFDGSKKDLECLDVSNLKIDIPIFNLSPFSHYNIAFFLNRKSWVPGPIPGRKCTGLFSTEFRLCVYQEDPSQHHHYFQARNIHVWRQIIFGLVRGFFCPCYQSVVYKLLWWLY